MDFQAIVDGIDAMTCVVSVEKLAGGGCGTIRVVTGNRAYLESIEHPAPGTEMLTRKFVPNSEYTRYLTRDLNFEDFCYRSAVEKKCLHAYVRPDRMDAWLNMTFLPLASEEGGLYYCTYTMELSREHSAERMSNVSGELASAVLETSLKLRGARDFEAAMGEVIRDVRLLCGAEYGCVLLMDHALRTCRVLCEDLAEETELRRSGSLEGAEFYAIAARWEAAIAGSNCLMVKSERDKEVVRARDPAWYASLREANIQTLVLFPLKTGDELLGYIWAANFDPERSGRIKETLELTTFILSSEIANFLLLHQLRRLSSQDLLTGVNNRNRLSERIAALSEGREGAGGPVGVVYADLNGLKEINDTEGHVAGDALLRDAAGALRQVFREEEIFRVGGDEFTMILSGASEASLAEKEAALRRAAAKYPRVEFAIGSCAVEDGRDIDEALRRADQRMYADKKRYYELHPEKSRRAR